MPHVSFYDWMEFSAKTPAVRIGLARLPHLVYFLRENDTRILWYTKN